MAHEMVRKVSGSLAKANKTGVKKAAKKMALKHAAKKHAAKHAAKKHAAKKHVKKAAKHMDPNQEAGLMAGGKGNKSLRKAFHHLQRASVVISLIEKGTDGDLSELFASGVDLYKIAIRVGGKGGSSEAALGILRAAEHLGMAGLYAARLGYRVQVEVAPPSDKDAKRIVKVRDRLDEISVTAEGYWTRVRALALELLRRAEAVGDDAHLEWELGMAAEALCDALETAEI